MKKIILLAGIALMAAACSNNGDDGNEPQPQPEERVALQVSANIAGGAATKVSGTSWNEGDAIGIFMLEGPNLRTPNRRYINAGGTGFVPATTGEALYYDIDNDAPTVDFVAYYPYSSTQNGLGCTVGLADQTDQAALDLLTADKVTGKSKKDPAVAFNFRHRLVKMELTLVPGNGISSNLAGINISLSGQHTEGICDLSTGEVQPTGNAGTIRLLTAANGRTAEAILMPAKGTAGRQLTFELAWGETFRYTIPDDRQFNAGEKHAYTLTLDRTSVGISATITDWTTIPSTGTAK